MDPRDRPVLMNERSDMPKGDEYKLIETLFETLDVHAFCIAPSIKLALLANGRFTGSVIDIGGGITEVGSCYEGTLLPPATCIPVGGSDVTNYMVKILRHLGGRFDTRHDEGIVHKAKEKWGYVALDFDEELKKTDWDDRCSITYPFSTGDSLTLTNERFQCPEILFNPRLNAFQFDGIVKILVDDIMKRDVDIREELFANICLSGGSTMFPGFAERLEKEITSLAPTMRVNVVAMPERKNAVWIGGSILASLPTFPQMLITSDEYEECGFGIVRLKCF